MMQKDALNDLMTASTEDRDKRSLIPDSSPTLLLYGLQQVRKQRGICSGQNLTLPRPRRVSWSRIMNQLFRTRSEVSFTPPLKTSHFYDSRLYRLLKHSDSSPTVPTWQQLLPSRGRWRWIPQIAKAVKPFISLLGQVSVTTIQLIKQLGIAIDKPSSTSNLTMRFSPGGYGDQHIQANQLKFASILIHVITYQVQIRLLLHGERNCFLNP